MRIPERARARPGKAIPKTWRELQRYADKPPPRPGRGTRSREFPDETVFYTPPAKNTWPHPWRTALSGLSATVAPGLVNNEMPRAGKDLLTLDGRDLEGNEVGRRPAILISVADGGGPGPDGRSFLCVRVEVDPATGEVTKEDRPGEWLTVVHRKELPRGYESGAMPEVIEGGASVGYFAIAILYWGANEQPGRILHPAHHHLQHQFVAGGEDEDGNARPNRHRFFV